MLDEETIKRMADDIAELKETSKAIKEQSDYWHSDLPSGGSRASKVDEMITAWADLKAGRMMVLKFGQALLWVSAVVTAVAVFKDNAAEALKEWLK
jgi:hypothetical protein